MDYIKDFRNHDHVRILTGAIERITTRPWNIMEVCGGQTYTIARYQIEDMLPSQITLLHGPGCPVCVTPVGVIDQALELARHPEVILATFGDMMRVPGTSDDLLRTKARGGDVRLLYSPLDAVDIAAENPDKEVVFFAVGFETSAPVHLMALKESRRRGLHNFYLLTSLFAVPPVMEAILSQEDNLVDGFLAAGHVCAVTGNEAYYRLAEKFHRPIVVSGFEPVDLLYGIYLCLSQLENREARVENAYKRAVPETGNLVARELIGEYLEPADQDWRGIGLIPASGWKLKEKYKLFDAQKRFPFHPEPLYNNTYPGLCIAGEIMKGKKQVADCPCFGVECRPEHPIGAPMVSSEGVCAAYFGCTLK